MKKKIKKAFTLVELLVVIAILAILATVSIVGYNSFTKKAKVSNDTALVSQLNTLLKADSMVNGDAKTPTDALKITSEAGYDVEKLTPTASDYDIIWNQAVNQFALLDENDNVVYGEKSTDEYKNWKFVSKYNTATDYSVYLKGTNFDTIPTGIHAGIDVGNNTKVNKINYKNDVAKDDVVIRTNGGTLNVNAENDTIRHFGSADRVKVTAVANESYHEFGEVIAIEVSKGRVVVEDNSNVTAIVTSNKDVNILLSENSSSLIYAPEGTNTNGASIKGTPDQVSVSGLINGKQYFAGGSGTENDPYLIDNQNQLISKTKNSTSMESLAGYYKLVSDITLDTEVYLSGKKWTLDLNGHTISLEYAATSSVNNGSTLYIANGTLNIIDTNPSNVGSVLGAPKAHPRRPSYVYSAVRTGYKGKLKIYGGYFKARLLETSCIYTYATSATVDIYGGKFETASSFNDTYFVLNHEDGLSGGSKMIVHGGSFVNYNPGVTVVDPVNAKTGTISLASGCTTTETTEGSNTIYTVTKN